MLGVSGSVTGFCTCASEREVSISRTSDNRKEKMSAGCRKEKCLWKSNRRLMGDGKVKREVSNVQQDHDPVEHTMEENKRFLVDETVRRKPTTPIVSWPC